MRIAALATSAVLLSGCSWLGLGGNSADNAWNNYNRGAQAAGRYYTDQAQVPQIRGHQGYAQNYQGQQRSYGPCEITSVSQPVPQGCSPEQVTIALPSGQYGQNQGYGAAAQNYSQAPSVGSYGKSLGDINRAQAAANQGFHKYWQRPRFRLTGTTGFERSFSGDAYNADALAGLYDVTNHLEATITGSQAEGNITTNEYEVRVADVPRTAETLAPDVRYSDVYSAPFTIGAGAEYQLNDRFAVFANAGYSAAQGGQSVDVSYEGDVHELGTIANFVEDPDTPGTYIADGAVVNTNTSRSDVLVARTRATANDMRRTNLEIGGRYYFKDAFAKQLERPLTPYIGASAGASHYNALEVSQNTEELLLVEFWNDPANPQYSREGSASAVEIIQEGWVPTGTITVGAEWQITPKAALAFETGLRYEGGREFTAGGESDDNFAIPLTLRGSIGF